MRKRRARAASKADPSARAVHETQPRPLLYTAQDVARFCEVDLKTIHHWADAGKITHHRTEGRHLRFRRNDLVRFLRSHGYPLHDEIVSARPTVFLAEDASPEAVNGAAPANFGRRGVAEPASGDVGAVDRKKSIPEAASGAAVGAFDVGRKLSARFHVRRYATGISAIANLVSGEPDALILALDDATIAGTGTIAALKADPATAWTLIVVLTDDPTGAPHADLVLPRADLARVTSLLVERLALD